MAYQYNIQTSKKDNRANACLFSCHTISEIVNLFVNTFLVAYIYNFCTNLSDYLFKVAIYNIVTYIFFQIFYLVAAKIVDKTNRVWIYRLSLLLRAGLVIVAIFCGQNIAQMLVLAGFLNGASDGFYYASYNVLKQEMVSRKSMKTFAVVVQVLTKIVEIVIPVVMGALIEVSTYAQVSIYVLIICAIQIGLSFGIKAQKPEGSNFSIKNYFYKLKQTPQVYNKIKAIYVVSFVYGFASVVNVLMNVCIMFQFGSSFSLGALTSAFAVASIVVILLVNKFSKAGKRGILLSIFAILPVITSILFSVWPSVASLIIFGATSVVCRIVYQTLFDIHRNSTLKEVGLYSEIAEHQAVVETLLNSTRIISYVLLLVLGLIQNTIVFKIMFVVLMLGYTATFIALLVYEKKYCKNQSNSPKTLETNDKSDIIETTQNTN